MELGVFPVRTVEANSSKQVSGGNDNRYANNESAASKADSGDNDAFSRHMRSNDEKQTRDDRNTSSEKENTGEQKVNEAAGDKRASKAGDGDTLDSNSDNKGFVAVEIAVKNDIPVKKEGFLSPLIKSPSMTGEFKLEAVAGATMEKVSETPILLVLEPKGHPASETGSSLLKTSEVTIGAVKMPIMDTNKTALTSAISLKTMPAAKAVAVMTKPGAIIPPVNGSITEGIALPLDLVLDVPLDDLRKIDVADLTNFKTVKTAPLISQPTVNASLTTFAAGLSDFQSLMETGIETKGSIIGGTEALSAMKPSIAPAVQAMAAAQPAAATAAAQLVAAIRTESKSGNIEVRLDPPEMGRVRISLSVETADAVKAVLTVERPETLDHLRRNMAQFTDDLRLAGFTSVDVEFSENGGSSAFQDEAGAPEHDPFASFVAETTPNNIVYLSLRENAQLDLLV